MVGAGDEVVKGREIKWWGEGRIGVGAGDEMVREQERRWLVVGR